MKTYKPYMSTFEEWDVSDRIYIRRFELATRLLENKCVSLLKGEILTDELLNETIDELCSYRDRLRTKEEWRLNGIGYGFHDAPDGEVQRLLFAIFASPKSELYYFRALYELLDALDERIAGLIELRAKRKLLKSKDK